MTSWLTQPYTILQAQRNPSRCPYAAAFQREAANRLVLANVIIPNSNKRNYFVLFGAPDPREFLKLDENKKKTKEKISNNNQSTLSNETVTAWKDEV